MVAPRNEVSARHERLHRGEEPRLRFRHLPGFWEWMDAVCDGDVASIVSVRDEMTGGKDQLADWAKDRKDAAWILAVDDVDTQSNFAEIVQHVATAHYSEPLQNSSTALIHC